MKQQLIEAAIVITCLEFGCTPQQVLSGCKMQPIVDARRVIIRLLRMHSGLMYKAIAVALNRDHSTLSFHMKQLEQMIIIKDPICIYLNRAEHKFQRFIQQNIY
jgi:chromosomal replication initiation ATPase DnaA